jgi:hypothetical protein
MAALNRHKKIQFEWNVYQFVTMAEEVQILHKRATILTYLYTASLS